MLQLVFLMEFVTGTLCALQTAGATNLCAGVSFGFHASPTDCTKYVICSSNSVMTEASCTPGLLFNPATSFCDFPVNVKNCSGTRPPTQPPLTLSPVITARLPTNRPVSSAPNTQQPTFMPVTNSPQPSHSPNPSISSAPHTQQPTFWPVTNSPRPSNSPYPWLTPFATNAPLTYAPLQTAHPSQQPRPTAAPITNTPNSGLTFPVFTRAPTANPFLPQTNAPTANPFLPQTNAPTANPFLPQTNAPTANPFLPQTNAPTANPFLPQTNGPVLNNLLCIGRPDGYFIDPTDCGYFYQCSFGQAVREPCPPRLVFNEQTTSCDYVVNVPACANYNGRK